MNPANLFDKFLKSGKIMLAAHRGERRNLPENTMPAFRYAMAAQADAIETDIHRTKDGVLVIFHDHEVSRTTNGEGAVRDKTLAEMKALDAGVKFGERYAGTRVPTLAEFFDFVKPYPDLLLNLELKDYPEHVGETAFVTADETIAMAEAYGLGERIMINSFSWEVLRHVHRKYGDRYPLHGFYPAFTMHHPKEDLYPYLDYVCMQNVDLDAEGKAVRPDRPMRPAEDFTYVKEVLGCEPCVCFSVDTPELMQTAIDRGVTMFTCNEPAEAAKILKSLGYRRTVSAADQQ